MSTITVYNGNGQKIEKELPTIILPKFGNEVARAHFEKNTGLQLKDRYAYGYRVKLQRWSQLAKILMTYNYESTYYNNASWHNTLMLRFKREDERI